MYDIVHVPSISFYRLNCMHTHTHTHTYTHAHTCTYMHMKVTVYFHNTLYRGNRCTKTDSSSYEAFSSPNLPPLATVGVDIQSESHDRDIGTVVTTNPFVLKPMCSSCTTFHDLYVLKVPDKAFGLASVVGIRTVQ